MTYTAEVLDRFPLAIAADRFFDAAALSYLESFVAWRRGLGGFNKVISCGARQRIMKCVLRLHFGNATENPDDGATFERLLAHANPPSDRDGCGPRVLRTVIALAQRSGHLAVSQGWFDRRLKILKPTEKWIAQEADRHGAALDSLALLTRDRSRFLRPPRGAALVARIAMTPQFDHAVGVTLGAPDGALRDLAALDGGLSTVFAVAEAFVRGKRIPSHKELGASFRLSASQARKILRLAADHDLVTFDRSGKIADASGLARDVRRLISHEMALYARCATPVRLEETALAVASLAHMETSREHAH